MREERQLQAPALGMRATRKRRCFTPSVTFRPGVSGRRVAAVPPKRLRKLSRLPIPHGGRHFANRRASREELCCSLHPDAAQVAAEIAAPRFCERALELST